MAREGWSARARGWVNILFALTCPAGVLAFYFGWEWLGADRPIVLAAALAFSAGVFLCISLGDLLPEVHFHHHDRAKLTAALLVGIAIAYGIGFLEGEHAHEHHPHGGQTDHPHAHDRH
jgi:zinc and cadmium transporter